jgi:cytochrome c553
MTMTRPPAPLASPAPFAICHLNLLLRARRLLSYEMAEPRSVQPEDTTKNPPMLVCSCPKCHGAIVSLSSYNRHREARETGVYLPAKLRKTTKRRRRDPVEGNQAMQGTNDDVPMFSSGQVSHIIF